VADPATGTARRGDGTPAIGVGGGSSTRATAAGGYRPVWILAGLSVFFLGGLVDLAWGVVFGLRLRLTDAAFAGAVLASRSPGWLAFMVAYTHVGDELVSVGIVLALSAVLWFLKRRAYALFLFGVTLSAVLVNSGLKVLVDRTRPPAMLAAVPLPHSASFPSGHAVIGITLAGALAIIVMVEFGVPRGIVPAAGLLALGALVGISRIYIGVHWLSDVLGGWALALAWLCAWSAGWLWILVRADRRLRAALARR
jgi:undecaprenyl-diphosphatase